MAKKRALKDAAQDPLAAKQTAVSPRKPKRLSKPLNLGRLALTVGVAVVLGFVGGVAASRWVRII